MSTHRLSQIMRMRERERRKGAHSTATYELLFRQKVEPRDIGDIVLLYTFKIHLYISFISPTHNTQP